MILIARYYFWCTTNTNRYGRLLAFSLVLLTACSVDKDTFDHTANVVPIEDTFFPSLDQLDVEKQTGLYSFLESDESSFLERDPSKSHYEIHPEFALSVPHANSQKSNDSILLVPVTTGLSIVALAVYSLEGQSLESVGTIDFTDKKGFGIVHLLYDKFGHSEYQHQLYTKGTLSTEWVEEKDDDKKGCTIRTIRTRNCVRLGPNGEYGSDLDCITISTSMVVCDQSGVMVPSNVTVNRLDSSNAVGGGGGNTGASSYPTFELIDLLLRLYPSCSTWNFLGIPDQTTIHQRVGVQGISGARITFLGGRPGNGRPFELRNVHYWLDVIAGVDPNVDITSAEFRMCVNLAYSFAIESIHNAYGTPPNGSNIRPVGLQQQPGSTGPIPQFIIPDETIINQLISTFQNYLNSPILSCGNPRDLPSTAPRHGAIAVRGGSGYYGGGLPRVAVRNIVYGDKASVVECLD